MPAKQKGASGQLIRKRAKHAIIVSQILRSLALAQDKRDTTRGSPRSFAAQKRLLRMTIKLTHYKRAVHRRARMYLWCYEHGTKVRYTFGLFWLLCGRVVEVLSVDRGILYVHLRVKIARAERATRRRENASS
jgi:hypothetical protein